MLLHEAEVIQLLQLIFLVAPTVLCIHLIRKVKELDHKVETLAHDNREMHHKS